MRICTMTLLAALSAVCSVAQTNSIQLRNGSNTTTLIAPSGGNYTLTLPAGAGTNGQALTTDGSGTLSWTSVSGGATSIDGLSDAKSGGTNFTGSLMLGQEPASLGINALQNTAVGIGALSSLTTGDNNVAVGYNALGSGSTSVETVAIGYNALAAGSSAGRVVAVGPEAASSCASCNYSVFIGRRAGAATNVVSDNTVVGNDAFRMNTSGSDNTVIGANAMENQTAGNFNTAVGRWAGVSNTTGSGSVFLGYNAGPTAAGAVNNSLYIHNASSNTPLIKGDFAATTLTFNGSITTTGTSALNGNVTVGGGASASELRMLEASGSGSNYTAFKAQAQAANVTYTLPAADGTSGQVLRTDGSGALSWTSAGATSIDGLSDAKSGGTDFTNSLLLGSEAVAPASGGALRNTGVGLGNTLVTLSTGDDNTAVGYATLASLASGYGVTAIGAYAMTNAIGASRTVAIGYGAGQTVTSGEYSVFVGFEAGKTYLTGGSSVAVGYRSLYVATGNHNVGVGLETMYTLSSGTNNVAIGNYAGAKITTGSSNVIIGYQAGPTSNVSNSLYIDNSETNTPLIYGDFSGNTLTFNGAVTTTGTSALNGNVTVGGGAAASEVRFLEPSAGGSNYTAFKAQAQTANVTYTLPAADGTSGQVLKTDGSGSLSFSSVDGTMVRRNYRNDVTGGTHIVQSTDAWIVVDRGFGTTTITLPDPTATINLYRELMFKAVQAQAVISDASNVVPITGGAAGTAILPATAGAWATLVCDGTNWVIMQRGQ